VAAYGHILVVNGKKSFFAVFKKEVSGTEFLESAVKKQAVPDLLVQGEKFAFIICYGIEVYGTLISLFIGLD
jgi:hypothetical protein